MQRKVRCFLLATASLALVACNTLPSVVPPRIAVDTVRMDRFSAGEAQFTITLVLTNPNDRELAVDAIDAELRIENVAIGTAQLAAPVRLAARGDAAASIVVKAGLAATLRAGAELARRAESEGGSLSVVRYAVNGVAVIDGGVTLPFSRSSEFPWPRSRVQ